MTTAKHGIKMLPYQRGGEIDYASLEFNPDEKSRTPDDMEQNLEIAEIAGVFRARFTDFNRRPDVFLDHETYICYDPGNLNVRVAPDVYLAFSVDAPRHPSAQIVSALGSGQAAGLRPGSGHRKARARRTSTANPASTPLSACRNTGGSTRPEANITTRR